MTYLLDTNVVSELRKPPRSQDAHVRAWARSLRPSRAFISVVSVLEIEIGIGRLERRDPVQAAALRGWLEGDLLPGFAGRLLSVDLDVVRSAARFHVPDPKPERDALLAATAVVHGLMMVTRNVHDFARTGVPVLNPWDAAPRPISGS